MVDMSVGVCTRDFSHKTVMNVSREGSALLNDPRAGETGGVSGALSSLHEMTLLALFASAVIISIETGNLTNSARACLLAEVFMIAVVWVGSTEECSTRSTSYLLLQWLVVVLLGGAKVLQGKG
jgi:hypothetical protein